MIRWLFLPLVVVVMLSAIALGIALSGRERIEDCTMQCYDWLRADDVWSAGLAGPGPPPPPPEKCGCVFLCRPDAGGKP